MDKAEYSNGSLGEVTFIQGHLVLIKTYKKLIILVILQKETDWNAKWGYILKKNFNIFTIMVFFKRFNF